MAPLCLCPVSGSPVGLESSLLRLEFCLSGWYPFLPFLYKEIFGSPKSPSYPFRDMPCSSTPVVSLLLACYVARVAAFRPTHTVGFHFRLLESLSVDHNTKISGLSHTAYLLSPSSFVLPLLGLHVDFPTDLLARL